MAQQREPALLMGRDGDPGHAASRQPLGPSQGDVQQTLKSGGRFRNEMAPTAFSGEEDCPSLTLEHVAG